MTMKHDDPKPMDAAKAVQSRKCIVIQPFLKKQEKSQINNLTYHQKELERKKKKQSPKSAVGRK